MSRSLSEELVLLSSKIQVLYKSNICDKVLRIEVPEIRNVVLFEFEPPY